MSLQTFSFIKVDGVTGERLEGATFELISEDLVIATATSNTEGIVKFRRIEPGRYTMRESIAPDGYLPNPEEYDILIKSCRATINGITSCNFKIKNYPDTLTYNVTYMPNNYKLTDEPVVYTVDYNTTITIINNPFTAATNLFIGWNTESDSSGTYYNPGDSLLVTNDIVLYGIWQSNNPVIYIVYPNATAIPGFGVVGAEIRVFFPNGDISIADTTNTLWNAPVPASSLPLQTGQLIKAIQRETGMRDSIAVLRIVS